MYTAFCTDIRAALSGLWASVQKFHTAQTRNADSNVYTPDYAEAENKKLDGQKADACKAAREKINSICDRAHEDAATLDTIELFNVEPDDRNYKRLMELLSWQFTLSVEQIQHIVDEYIPKTDNVLLNAVSTYCEKNGMHLKRATAVSRRTEIEKIRASALSVVSRIESTSYRNGNRDFGVGLSVSSFCEDGDFASDVYARLGQKFDGETIAPVVTPEGGGFDFSFRGVRDAEKKDWLITNTQAAGLIPATRRPKVAKAAITRRLYFAREPRTNRHSSSGKNAGSRKNRKGWKNAKTLDDAWKQPYSNPT